jgi:hypothetical protein
MNEAMKTAWLEISQMVNVTTPEELDVFLRTWQRAIQAEREACAKVCDDLLVPVHISLDNESLWEAATLDCADAIRARGNT